MTSPLRRHALWLVPFLLAPLSAQIDQKAAAEELAHAFDRPAGTPIGADGKRKLAEWLQKYAGQDLGPLGYARALQLYLDRDYPGAIAELDRFFAAHDTIENEEHRRMLGRICMNGLVQGARSGEPAAKLALHGERAAKLYGDLSMIARAAQTALTTEGVDQQTLRVGLLRGALASGADAAAIDAFAKALYGGEAPAVQARPARAARAEAQGPTPAALTGKPVPAIEALHVIGGGSESPDAASFSLDKLRGKVVLLDFTATWCGPCRKVVPHLIALQNEHSADLQVVGVTRLYGYGMDFSAPEATTPNGGTVVRNLTPEAELQVNRVFVDKFGIGYPIVVAGGGVAREQFHVSGIPTLFVVGRDGSVVGSVVGTNEADVDALIEKALAAK